MRIEACVTKNWTNRWNDRSMGTRAAHMSRASLHTRAHRHSTAARRPLRIPRRTSHTVFATKNNPNSESSHPYLPNDDDRVSSSSKASSTSGKVFLKTTLVFAAFVSPHVVPFTANWTNSTSTSSSLFAAHATDATKATSQANSQTNKADKYSSDKNKKTKPKPQAGVDYPKVTSRAVTARQVDFYEFLDGVRGECAKRGVSENTISSCFDYLEPYPEPEVVEPKVTPPLDVEKQSEKQKLEKPAVPKPKKVEKYVANLVSKERVEKGAELLLKHSKLLSEIEQEYGVPAEVLVAIWGIESSFGGFQGNTNAVEALANISWSRGKDGNVSDMSYFKNELVEAVRIVDRGLGGVKDTKEKNAKDNKNSTPSICNQSNNLLIGSWDGGLGHCQFMPSNYFRYAVDRDGDGAADIWNSLPDTFASMGNFIKNYCEWDSKVGVPGFLVTVKDSETLELLKKNDAIGSFYAERKQSRPFKFFTWNGIEVKPKELTPNPSWETYLLMPDGEESDMIVFLATSNFRSLMRYNPSTQYAMAVSTLAREIYDTAAVLENAKKNEIEETTTTTAISTAEISTADR
mgnify:CR=1 FL=1